MPTTISMLTDALPQLLDFSNELLTGHLFEVGVHDVLPGLIGIAANDESSE